MTTAIRLSKRLFILASLKTTPWTAVSDWGMRKRCECSGWILTSGCQTRRGSTEREHSAALQEVTRSAISNIIHRNQITRGLFRLRDFYRFDLYLWITIMSYLWNQWKCSIYPTAKLIFSQLHVWLIIFSMIWWFWLDLIDFFVDLCCVFLCESNHKPHRIISFSALFPLYLLVSVFCFSEKPFSTFCGADEPNKSSLIVAQIYTQHTWGERERERMQRPRAQQNYSGRT